jgi:hypothetical protein
MKSLGQDSWYHSQDSNQTPLKYKPNVSSLEPRAHKTRIRTWISEVYGADVYWYNSQFVTAVPSNLVSLHSYNLFIITPKNDPSSDWTYVKYEKKKKKKVAGHKFDNLLI